MDITISKAISVVAENEEAAARMAEEMVRKDPYYYARCADSYVSCEVDDVYEDED